MFYTFSISMSALMHSHSQTRRQIRAHIHTAHTRARARAHNAHAPSNVIIGRLVVSLFLVCVFARLRHSATTTKVQLSSQWPLTAVGTRRGEMPQSVSSLLATMLFYPATYLKTRSANLSVVIGSLGCWKARPVQTSNISANPWVVNQYCGRPV